jgi:hypothetical protein
VRAIHKVRPEYMHSFISQMFIKVLQCATLKEFICPRQSADVLTAFEEDVVYPRTNFRNGINLADYFAFFLRP